MFQVILDLIRSKRTYLRERRRERERERERFLPFEERFLAFLERERRFFPPATGMMIN